MVKHKHKSAITRMLLAFGVTTIVLAIVGFGLPYLVKTYTTAVRKDRIVAIYDSLQLGPDYMVTGENIFGDKRPYSWDKGRTFSSSRSYVHNANVDVTAAELQRSIESAGFKYFETPYPGSVITELHFKSANNEYIRLTVSSRPRDTAFRELGPNHITPSSSVFALDPNAAPSNVLIKVNLDDNNE